MLPRPYCSGDPNRFATATVTGRLPKIFTEAARDFEEYAHGPEEALAEARLIIAEMNCMISDFKNNGELQILGMINPDDELYNSILDAGPLYYHNAPWLFYECYAYRRLQQFFDRSKFWTKYDVFATKKDGTFNRSQAAVGKLAARFLEIQSQVHEIKKRPLLEQLEKFKPLFEEMVMTSLWANATDLSLHVNLSPEQLKYIQESSAQRQRDATIINDFEQLWAQVRSSVGGRIDIVLDNSGFELFADLIMALFLLEAGLAENIVLHPKNHAWFVSDVTPRDWLCTLALLENRTNFFTNREAIDNVIATTTRYEQAGKIVMHTSYFWTLPIPFWELKVNGKYGGHNLWYDLRASKVVIFKGDLNYRKLTGDLEWPRNTPFSVAIQDLGSNRIPFVALRVCKSDVLVGLSAEKSQELDAMCGPNWPCTGNFAVISYSASQAPRIYRTGI